MTEAGPAGARPRLSRAWAIPALVALVASLPFAPGILAGRTLYFRDLIGQFFPLRLFALEGVRHGELRFWNPYVHEGEPASLPPISYPLDLVQLLRPDEAGVSATLALHVPFAALAFFLLARHLGLGRNAAAGGALVYALGGFALSTLNLYVYVQAAAWAPFVVLGLHQAVRSRAAVVPAALACAVALSTTGVEVVAQAILLGLVVAIPGRNPWAWLRSLGAVGLGAGLAAPTIAYMAGLVAGSARAGGFPTDVVLAHSVHPLTLVQVLVAGLYGDPGQLVNRWWGTNFFPKGFPYFLSLYLGATALALAAVGVRVGGGLGRRVALAAGIALVVCLGRWAGLSTLVELMPFIRSFRFPSKAFFTVHASVALLAALGLEALASRVRAGWRCLSISALALGLPLLALPLAPIVLPRASRWFALGFFPPEYSWSGRVAILGEVLRDAARGGLVATLAGLVALLVLRSLLRPESAAVLVSALVAADLLRAGTGLNPSVAPSLIRPSPETTELARALREQGGRVYTPDLSGSAAYARGRQAHPHDHELWSFGLVADTATPFANMALGLHSALSVDLTMLVPLERVLPPEQARPEAVPDILPSLRNAGVAHVLSLDALAAGPLVLRSVLDVPRMQPLRLYLYDLESPLQLRSLARNVVVVESQDEARALAARDSFQDGGSVAVEGDAQAVTGATGRVVWLREGPGWLDAEVQSDRPSVFFVRDSHAAGWFARVDGRSAPVLRANGHHRAVPVPAGRSRVTLRYRPRFFAWGLTASLVSALAAATLWVKVRSRERA